MLAGTANRHAGRAVTARRPGRTGRLEGPVLPRARRAEPCGRAGLARCSSIGTRTTDACASRRAERRSGSVGREWSASWSAGPPLRASGPYRKPHPVSLAVVAVLRGCLTRIRLHTLPRTPTQTPHPLQPKQYYRKSGSTARAVLPRKRIGPEAPPVKVTLRSTQRLGGQRSGRAFGSDALETSGFRYAESGATPHWTDALSLSRRPRGQGSPLFPSDWDLLGFASSAARPALPAPQSRSAGLHTPRPPRLSTWV